MILKITNVKKSYSDKFLFQISDLVINKGEKVAIVGLNGSGKSTFLKILLDLLKLDSGEVFIFNYLNHKVEDWKIKTSSFLDNTYLIDFLTINEYLLFLTGINSNTAITNFVEKLNFYNLDRNKRISNLSSGNKRKVGIIAALMRNTELCILDEPSNYLDIQAKQGLINYIKNLVDRTFVIADHDIDFLAEFATRIIILKNGEIVFDGPIMDEPKAFIKKFYSQIGN